jgi:hypothetical protein
MSACAFAVTDRFELVRMIVQQWVRACARMQVDRKKDSVLSRNQCRYRERTVKFIKPREMAGRRLRPNQSTVRFKKYSQHQ